VNEQLLTDVARYYSDRLHQHGPTAAGMDWRDAESQRLRFIQLAKLVTQPAASLIDVGCGSGALLTYLRALGHSGAYYGIDIAPDMVSIAMSLHGDDDSAQFLVGPQPDLSADYAVASGIFNVRLQHDLTEWVHYVESTIQEMDRMSRLGFAFNCLTSYSDPERMRPDLYYPDPCQLFDLCKRRYSRQVALLHDYGLWEFTLIVRKPLAETAHG
jgi:SAM-dependent methyltransferase